MDGLIGYTGFVGQNLDDGHYEYKYHSKNIEEIRGRSFDTLVCAGVPGHKTLANQYPDRDRESIRSLAARLELVRCRRLILISTVDVYPEGVEADESYPVKPDVLNPYGAHRVWMEEFVTERFPDCCIIRLPGIFGKGLKKNFIFDLMFGIPRMLNEDELDALAGRAEKEDMELVRSFYELTGKGTSGKEIWELKAPCGSLLTDPLQRGPHSYQDLREVLERYGYDSLRFTDSRSEYSYYCLKWLIRDMNQALADGLPLVNLVTEPMTAGELASEAFGRNFENHLEGREPARFRVRSRYAGRLKGQGGYIYGREQVIRELQVFDRKEIRI